MSVILLSSDLFSSSPISGAAKVLNAEFQCIMSQQDFKNQLSNLKPTLVIIDLGCGKFETEQCVSAVKSVDANIPIIAFGPHVHEKKLAQAEQVGCTATYTKGQFLQQTKSILQQHLGL